jgi:hypothetical protein
VEVSIGKQLGQYHFDHSCSCQVLTGELCSGKVLSLEKSTQLDWVRELSSLRPFGLARDLLDIIHVTGQGPENLGGRERACDCPSLAS